MADNLTDFLSSRKKRKFATDSGSGAHTKMQHIIIDGDREKGDADLIRKIKLRPEILPYFSRKSRSEVPIAGKINGRIISRRIDRMIVNNDDKTIVFIDYKTDLDKNAFRDKYAKQMSEYSQLLKNIYPDYSVRGLILWLHDFTVEQIS
ncbi:MAG: hypothetical protein LBJ73_03890 [Rickettsiales bacterium]|jgi:ATP-dependent exoDNAse (exonuclease V) beta subunit|nr:hypothetical protein [Rickettsiales bacterium]